MRNYRERWLYVGQGAGFQAVEANTGIFQALEELGLVPDRARASSGSALFCSLYYSGWDAARFREFEDTTTPFDWVDLCPWQTLKTVAGRSNHCMDNAKVQQLLLKEMTFEATRHLQVSVTRMDDYSTHMRPATPDWSMAAGSIPFVLPTIRRDGACWGDGGVLNNVPMPALEECGQYERIILFLAPPTEYDGAALGLRGIASLMLAVMSREETQLSESGYMDLPNLVLIRPGSAFGGHLFRWSDDFSLRGECHRMTRELLQ